MYDRVDFGNKLPSGPFETYNYNISTGKRLYLNQVLTSISDYKKVHTYAYKKLKKQDYVYASLEPDFFTIDKNTKFVYENSGISIIFETYEVAPVMYPNPKLKIPRSVYE
ncbi:DUF3298 domain-containing protein [Peribacillus sp. NPDC097295]|uniref:DUF3298 domain-containing protein n=1 Tax=Peribacillus sp. NPDC097295 TaxID=3364402 RepID=UPI00380639D4